MVFKYLLAAILLAITCLSPGVESSLRFEIQADKQRCYIEELFLGSVMMIKWKIVGVNESDEKKAENFYKSIQLYVLAENSQRIVKKEFLPAATGKLSYNSEEEGHYKVCIVYHGGWTLPYNAFISLKISSDNMDEPDIEKALKIGDVDHLHQKAKNILGTGKEIIEKQEHESSLEDVVAQNQIEITRTYHFMTVIQILVILALGIFQIFNFRKFLSTNNVI